MRDEGNFDDYKEAAPWSKMAHIMCVLNLFPPFLFRPQAMIESFSILITATHRLG